MNPDQTSSSNEPNKDPQPEQQTKASSATTQPNSGPAETNQAGATEQSAEGTEINHSTIMGVLCYLGPLVLVPYFTDRSDPFIKFHIKQGFVLLGLAILSFLISSFLPFLFIFAIILIPLLLLYNLFLLVLVIIGIVNVVKKAQKPLPLVGGFAAKINI